MATKDITDVQVCEAVREANECHFQHFPYDFLGHWTRQPFKVCYCALERASRHGLIECGVSLRTGWLTEKGKALLREASNESTPRGGEVPR